MFDFLPNSAGQDSFCSRGLESENWNLSFRCKRSGWNSHLVCAVLACCLVSHAFVSCFFAPSLLPCLPLSICLPASFPPRTLPLLILCGLLPLITKEAVGRSPRSRYHDPCLLVTLRRSPTVAQVLPGCCLQGLQECLPLYLLGESQPGLRSLGDVSPHLLSLVGMVIFSPGWAQCSS